MSDFGIQLDPSRRRSRSGHEPTKATQVVGVVTTILLHGLIAGLMVWGTMRSGEDIQQEIEPKMLEFEDVELLALGEEKPPNQLPRKANPAPPPVEEDAVNLAEPEEKPEPKEKEEKPKEEPPEKKKDDRKKRMAEALQNLQHNPNRPSNTDTPEGSAEGVAGGTATDAMLANMMRTFQAKLMSAIVKRWHPPSTLSDAELKKLIGSVEVFVRLSDSGYVTGYTFKRKSDNPQYNQSIELALKKFQGGHKLPLPDNPEVRGAVLQKGLDLKKWDPFGR